MPLVPTGVQHTPASRAHGGLILYNGSLLTQELPAGFLLTTPAGIDVVTDAAVVVPAAHLPQVGEATVWAHAVRAGTAGNLAAGAPEATFGPSLSITNRTAWTGGRDASTRRFLTPADQAKALQQARAQLAHLVPRSDALARPCQEQRRHEATRLDVAWRCQEVGYPIPPGVQVCSVQLVGATVILTLCLPVQPA